MEDWTELMAGRTFITDLGAPRESQVEGKTVTLERYAVWSPMKSGEGHTVVEVGGDLAALMARYSVSADRVCTLSR